MKVKDPVCGMEIDSTKATASMNHQGETYYFCCEGCQRHFEANPQSYLEGNAGGATPNH
ncbi:MAG: YHS domain-containing protein [bacterium]